MPTPSLVSTAELKAGRTASAAVPPSAGVTASEITLDARSAVAPDVATSAGDGACDCDANGDAFGERVRSLAEMKPQAVTNDGHVDPEAEVDDEVGKRSHGSPGERDTDSKAPPPAATSLAADATVTTGGVALDVPTSSCEMDAMPATGAGGGAATLRHTPPEFFARVTEKLQRRLCALEGEGEGEGRMTRPLSCPPSGDLVVVGDADQSGRENRSMPKRLSREERNKKREEEEFAYNKLCNIASGGWKTADSDVTTNRGKKRKLPRQELKHNPTEINEAITTVNAVDNATSDEVRRRRLREEFRQVKLDVEACLKEENFNEDQALAAWKNNLTLTPQDIAWQAVSGMLKVVTDAKESTAPESNCSESGQILATPFAKNEADLKVVTDDNENTEGQEQEEISEVRRETTLDRNRFEELCPV